MHAGAAARSRVGGSASGKRCACTTTGSASIRSDRTAPSPTRSSPRRSPCVRCGGRAVLSRDGGAWSRCPACEGTGGVWNRPFHEVDAAWRRVVAQWPDAGVPWVDLPAPARRSARRRGARNAAQDAISSDGVPRAAGMESSRPSAFYRRRGYSAHGLKFADVQRAFAEAEQLLGTEWRLKGRGHGAGCRSMRATPHMPPKGRSAPGRG